MQTPSRRDALRLTAASLGAALAGCLGDETDDDTDDGGDDPTTTEPTTEPSPSDLDTTVLQVDSSLTSDWWDDDDGPPGRVVAIGSEQRVEAVLDPDSMSGEAQEELQSFLTATDFESSTLVLVETVGPSTCYSEVGVENARIESGAFRADAHAVDDSEQGAACGDAITFPAALIRATVDGTPPETATLTVTNGWGDSADLTATVDDPIGPSLDDVEGYVRPEGDPETVPPTLSCPDDSFRRHASGYDASDVSWGVTGNDASAFALRTETLSASLGDTVTLTLTNVSEQETFTGNRHKYNVELLTENGWQDVRGNPNGDPIAYTDEALGHAPGEGFEWDLELTEDGLIDGHYNESQLTVCPDLQPGRYRVVFWEPTVAVAFDVEA